MGILSAFIDDAIDTVPFEGSIRPLPVSRRIDICPICRAKIDRDDMDSHVFNVHRHGLLLHTADGDSRFRDAVRQRQDLSTQQSIECLEFCLQALALYAKGDIDWEEEKRLALSGDSSGSRLKSAFIQLLFLIYSEDEYDELPFRRYQDLKSIYPRLHSLPGALGVAARAVIEVYFDWYECIPSSRGPFFKVASLFQPSRIADLLSLNDSPPVTTRTISICVPNQMIQFIGLASRAVTATVEDLPEARLLAVETADFYRSCPSIYKQKSVFPGFICKCKVFWLCRLRAL
ncbi:hypothetical protein VB734_00215 [Synechococcus sp. BA-124 BA4]|uniref:hypothetical protein n=1 Tax=Synechococcus sp. CBW1107 TaxID=2789857 RepID=UPI002AD51F78|nr:hypothetical protein [Synechococcus sp. CBW1107]MEA5398465.1 hypothetical protein [Synechococcus sp. BA-124 BA4]CAK6691901.1 hypothetical protein BBFGKLBO_01127 [Synechococcus sp. CBW1107]